MKCSPYIAHTHREWFDNLSRQAVRRGGLARLDEVNFWSPGTTKPLGHVLPGEPIFFRLGAPLRRIAGYGFFADHLDNVTVQLAWDLFGRKNGASTPTEFWRILGRTSPASRLRPIGCTILREVVFWPDDRWLPWGPERGYANTGVQRGRFESDPANVALLMGLLSRDGTRAPDDLGEDFRLVQSDDRRVATAEAVAREGQGTFRARLLKAYGGQCAVTREHTEPVLAAAHIQPYLGPASNHIKNGLILTQEFHTLFDRGLVCVEPTRGDYRLRVSDLLYERWNNGHRYRRHDGRILHVPERPAMRPSGEALEWHRENVFERVA